MDRFVLDGSATRVALPRGYAIRAPGLAGSAAVYTPVPGAAATRDAAPAAPELDEALRSEHVQEAVTIALSARNTPVPQQTAALRSASGDAALELEVPDLGPDRGQVVLAVSESGLMTWHFPLGTDGAPLETPATRGHGGVKRFRIPSAVEPPPPGDAQHRGIIGAAGRKLLKVLVYPVVDPVLGRIGERFAHRWEERKRPYRVRRMDPDSYAAPGAPQLTSDDWHRLTAGRTLLFVHGTFSTSHGCFGALPAAFVADLNRRYDNRVIAFDTFTLSEDPAENARRFLELVPAGIDLDLDVVCHSRGGLVTRQIGLQGGQAAHVQVRRIVFVGVPNGGTALADPDHMVQLIDRFTSALMLLPSGPVTETMEAILTVVKMIGHGLLSGLPGLAAMRPDGAFLKQLNARQSATAEHYAITADFEPGANTLGRLVRQHATDALADRVFRDAPNDLVVPTLGVYELEGTTGFPVPAERLLRFDARTGVIHTTYFGAPETAHALSHWLQV